MSICVPLITLKKNLNQHNFKRISSNFMYSCKMTNNEGLINNNLFLSTPSEEKNNFLDTLNNYDTFID